MGSPKSGCWEGPVPPGQSHIHLQGAPSRGKRVPVLEEAALLKPRSLQWVLKAAALQRLHRPHC